MKRIKRYGIWLLAVLLFTSCASEKPVSAPPTKAVLNETEAPKPEALYLSLASCGNWTESPQGIILAEQLEKLEEQETGLFRNNMADSIEVRVQKEAEAAGVRVKGVRLLEDGTVFISVSGQKHAEGAGQAVGAPGQSSEAVGGQASGASGQSSAEGAGQDSGISVEPVRPVGSTKARQEQFVLADGEALKGTAREDLKERFAAVIGIGQTQLEVVEVE